LDFLKGIQIRKMASNNNKNNCEEKLSFLKAKFREILEKE